MNKLSKNRIIAISGEPVSGKGTVVKELIKNLKEKGFLEENIHIISTGSKFRNYFEKILEFIQNFDDEAKIKEIAQDSIIQTILKNKEYKKILEETVFKIKNENINTENLSKIGSANSSEILKPIRDVVDSIIDTNTRQMGIDINKEERPNDIWIFDSRMAFDNIPEAFSIRLTTSPQVAGKRLFMDNTRGKNDSYKSIEDAQKAREERRIGEINRYEKKYGINLEDERNYNLIIDTSYAKIEDIANTILKCQEAYIEDKPFGKKWASPITMLPCQSIRDTWDKQPFSGWDLKSLAEDIKEKGYNIDNEIDIFNVNGINYILEGHHRNFACIMDGITLIPYIDNMQTEYGKERIEKGNLPTTYKVYMYDHEDFVERCLRKNSENPQLKFSYEDVYPGIYEKIKDRDDYYL